MTTRFTMVGGKKGFTLIEVIITLSIFLLLAAAVFGIFTATLESVSSLQNNQNQSDEVEALGFFLKKSLMDLPPEGTINSYHREGEPFKVAGIILGSGDNLRALDMHLQLNGNYTLQYAAYAPPALASVQPLADFQRQILTSDAALSWRTLVREVHAADWRFKMVNTDQWLDQSSGLKPAVVEFTVQLAGANEAVVDDFWVPPTQPAGNAVAAAALPAGGTP